MGLEWRKLIFVSLAFLLGSINGLYNIGFYIFLIVAFLINLSFDFKGCMASFRKEWKYLILPVFAVLYLVLHYVVSLLFCKDVGYKPSWSTVELLLLYFFFIPVYLLSARNIVTPLLLRRFLFALCWGILAFNFTKLFTITGLSLFTDPAATFRLLYAERFGGNMDMLGGFIYLEPQAIYICISVLIAYFFLLKQFWMKDRKSVVWQSAVILFFSLLFLSFTVTKAALLATGAGLLVLSFAYYKKMSGRCRILFGICLLVGVIGIYFLMPDAYMERIKDMQTEFNQVNEGDFRGGTVGPRAGLMKENFSHFDEFGLFGLGVYKKNMTREWYKNSSYLPEDITNAHNSFVEFWLRGGIPGLLFILYYFGASILRMRRLKTYSVLGIAMIVALFIANNTCVLIILVDSSPFVICMLAMCYLYLDKFMILQENSLDTTPATSL